jgi:hypothetical protein
MNLRKIKNIAFALALGLSFVGTPVLSGLFVVQAQDWQYPPRERGYPEYGQERYDRESYMNGVRMGMRDARDGRRFNPWRHDIYFTDGRYSRRAFRRGYEQGYQRAYYRRDYDR